MDEMLVKEFLRDNDVGKVVENEPMYKHTTYKVGGPARFFIEVKDMEALKRLLEFVRKNHIRHITLYGSLLVEVVIYYLVIVNMKVSLSR